MTGTDMMQIGLGTLQGLVSSSVFVLALFIGFCVIVGFTKTKKTAGHTMVIKSLDENMSGRTMEYLRPDAPRGPADQLKSPELTERH